MAQSIYGPKVRALLDTADSFEAEGNAEAAATYRSKAEELMVKYRIEQEELIAQDPTSSLPIQRDMDLVGYGSKYKTEHVTMWYYIAEHTGVRYWAEWQYAEEGFRAVAHIVGYEEDVNYAEMLFTSARLVFAEKLEPRVDPALSEQVNAYRLRSAGIERIRIAQMLWGNTDKPFMARVGRLYHAECKERGEEPLLSGRGVTGKAYREQYAKSFVGKLISRLWAARQSAGAGGGLVLHGREQRVEEAFYAAYPDQRPKEALPTAQPQPCSKCARAKGDACNDHRIRVGRASKVDPYSIAAMRGRRAGAAAAQHVGINRSSSTGSLES